MKKFLPVGRFRTVLSVLAVCLSIGFVLSYSEQASSRDFSPQENSTEKASSLDRTLAVLGKGLMAKPQRDTGTLQKLIVTGGVANMDLDLDRLNGNGAASLRFTVAPEGFFTIQVFNNELRGPLPSTMVIVPQTKASLPEALAASYRQLVIESMPWGGEYDLTIRDGKTGFVFFNIQGHEYNFDADATRFGIKSGRVLLSPEFAAELGRPAEAGSIVGSLSLTAALRAIEVSTLVDGEMLSSVMPGDDSPDAGTVPGPDVIVGELSGLAQFGSASGTQVGLAVGTDSCNAGVVPLNWFALPNNDHPVIPMNLYRMSAGAGNTDRFEQIGQSSLKHAFTALQNNICNFGCNSSGTGTLLGSGCSDPYSASLNSGQSGLGSRAWVNPFTGFYPRGDSGTSPNSHGGHAHNGTSHRIVTEMADLNTSLNAGATYYAESQYVTPHEYNHCQANPTQCNMNNNVSHRRYSVSGTASPFSFSPVGSTVRMKPAIEAWTGATLVNFQPAPGVDGIATIGYKVTNPSPGVWHYEYAIYNQNLDRAIQSFGLPSGGGMTISNVEFHAPPQHPGAAADGTTGSSGFSNSVWAEGQSGVYMTWSSETFAQNPNANAVRWGTLYNIRFDSNREPVMQNALVGFLKTGSPVLVPVQGPRGNSAPCFQPAGARRCS